MVADRVVHDKSVFFTTAASLNVTGSLVTDEVATEYWCHHVLQPVDLSEYRKP